MDPLNYAEQYSRALSQQFPHVLRFGALYNTPNNERYRVINAKTIEIPILKTSGRVDGDRDTISQKKRNYSNEWEPKVLTNHRTWSTLVHPLDIDQTNIVTTIQNITTVFNEEQKFPEMDRYCISKIYADWTALGNTAKTTTLTVDNILPTVDKIMETMDDRRVPETGRIMYCRPQVNTLIKQAKDIARTLNVKDSSTQITREITRIDELTIEKVPSDIMKTLFDFDEGAVAEPSAQSIEFVIIHPVAVFTPVAYEFAQLSEPAALSDGKWVYYEESFEDVFILNNKATAIDFVVA